MDNTDNGQAVRPPFKAYTGEEPFIFVSYSHADSPTVYPLIERLHNAGFRMWYDDGLHAGSDWREELAGALEDSSLLLTLFSPNAAASEHVRNEIYTALEEEVGVLPVHIEPTDLPRGLRLCLRGTQAIFKADRSNDEFVTELGEAIEGINPDLRGAPPVEPESPEPQRPSRQTGIAALDLVELGRTARSVSDEYLQWVQDHDVYTPDLYVPRAELEGHLTAFLDSKCTKTGMLVTGPSGIGKTNTLCHIVNQWRDDAARLGGDVVLMIGANHRLPEGDRQLRAALLDRLRVSDDFGDFREFLSAFDTARAESESQLVILIDGVDKHPCPDELLRQAGELIVGDSRPWLKVVLSIGETVYRAIHSSLAPTSRDYYTVTVDEGGSKKESTEVHLGRMTDDELEEAYKTYRRKWAPTSTFASLTREARNAMRDPLVLRIVMEAYDGRRIPNRVLTDEVLGRYCNVKIFDDDDWKREAFVDAFLDLLYRNKTTMALVKTLASKIEGIGFSKDDLLNSHQSPYTQLRDERVLSVQASIVNRRPRRTVGFTYDRLFEYLLVGRIRELLGATPKTIEDLSGQVDEYPTLRAVLPALIVVEIQECTSDQTAGPEAFDKIAALLRAGAPDVMNAVAVDVLVEMEQSAPAGPEAPQTQLARSPAGQLVAAMLRAPDTSTTDVLLTLAERLQGLGFHRRATFVCNAVLESVRHEKDLPARRASARALIDLGNINALEGRHEESGGHYQDCLDMVQAHDDLAAFRPRLLRSLANNLYRSGDLGQAEDRCNEWLDAEEFKTVCGQAEYLPLRADVLRIKGYVLLWNFRLDDAKASFAAGFELAEQLGDLYLQAFLLNNIAEVHRITGTEADLDEAQQRYERSLAMRQGIGDRVGIAMSNSNLGLIAMARGERCRAGGDPAAALEHYDKAREHLEEAIRVARSVGSDHRAGDAHNNLATLYRVQYQMTDPPDRDLLAKAIRHYRHAHDCHTASRMKNELGIIHSNLAKVGHLLGKDARALSEYEESDELFAKAGNHAYRAYVCHNIAFLKERLGTLEASEAADLLARKRESMAACSAEYPWPDALQLDVPTDLIDIPDI